MPATEPWVMKVLVPVQHPLGPGVPSDRGPRAGPPGCSAAPASEPGARLGQAPGAQHLAGGELWQVLLLLRLVGGEQDVAGAERVVRGHGQPQRAVGARDLLERDHVVVELHARRRRSARAPACRTGPSSPMAGMTSAGNRSSSSQRRACGITSRAQKSRTVFCKNLLFVRQIEIHRPSLPRLTVCSPSGRRAWPPPAGARPGSAAPVPPVRRSVPPGSAPSR